MASVERLVTLADLDDDGADVRHMSVSLRHEAVLSDGRRVLLMDDRGWGSSLRRSGQDGVPDDGSGPADEPGAWAVSPVDDIEDTARMVVGPDEPFGEHTQKDMEADQWTWLASILGGHGVVVDARELQRLPHDVVLSERLLARVGRDAGDAR